MITPGQAHDVTAYPALMEEVDDDPEQMLGDRGFDSDAVRNDIEKRGGEALIPTKANRKVQHRHQESTSEVRTDHGRHRY